MTEQYDPYENAVAERINRTQTRIWPQGNHKGQRPGRKDDPTGSIYLQQSENPLQPRFKKTGRSTSELKHQIQIVSKK